MSNKILDLRKYWDDRLSSNLNLKGTGHRAFSLKYNNYLYQAQADCLTKLLDKRYVNLKNKRVLDVGSGTGYYIDFYKKKEAGRICGIDISETSIKYLKTKFPDCDFYVEDISQPSINYLASYDLVSAISVLYHIIDDSLFKQALINLCSFCKRGGYLLISDALKGYLMRSASHAHLRRLQDYQPYIPNFKILEIAPIYYFLNRSLIPIIGPKIIDSFNLGSTFYSLDRRLMAKGWGNGNGMKFMLAQRID